MEFEWDEAKRQSNLLKHGIDFEDAKAVFQEFFYTWQDTRSDYGEERYVTIGLLQGVEVAVIHTPREGRYRIISVRRARIQERKMYYGAKNNRKN